MAADLHIHIATPEVTEQVLSAFFSHTMGSKYFNLDNDREEDTFDIIANTPSVWIGEVSWLKAALFEDGEAFIPDTVSQVSEIVGEDLPVIDDEFIEKIVNAFSSENKTGYSLAKSNEVKEFLNQYKGQRVFTVSW